MQHANCADDAISDHSITVHLPTIVDLKSLVQMCDQAGLKLARNISQPVSFRPTSREENAISKARLTLALANSRQNCTFSDLFFDPAWIMLLDLLVRENEGVQTSISSACVASHSASTTALRHVTEMVRRGILKRTPDSADCRRVFLTLGEQAKDELISALSKT